MTNQEWIDLKFLIV